MTEQPRQPAGTPAGGQFGATQRAEANVALLPLDGDYYYTPIFRTPDQVVDFWSRVELPDEALAACEETYVNSRDKVEAQMPQVLWDTHGRFDWDAAHPKPDAADVAATSAWEGERQSAKVDFVNRAAAMLADRPEKLNRKDVRPTVRAIAMYSSSFEMDDPAARDKVFGHRLDTSAGSKTVREIAEETGLTGVSRFFLNRDYVKKPSMDADKFREMLNDALSRANEDQLQAIENEIEEIRQGLRTVGQIVIDNT